MAAAADQAVDGVVHVLEGGVGSAAAVGGSGVRERGVVGLFGHQLIRRVVNGLSIGLESQVGEAWLALPVGTGIAHGTAILRNQTVTGRELRGGRLRMEGVVVQRVDNVHNPTRRIHADRRTVDRIWHRYVAAIC